MKYLVVIEEGPKSFGDYVPDLPGCIAAAETRIEGMKEDGLPIPPPHSSSALVEVRA